MGWGTSFSADIYISKKLFRSQYELDDEIDSLEKEIQSNTQTLLMYCSSTPRDISSPDWEVIPEIKLRATEIIESLMDSHYELIKLTLLKQTIEDGNYKFGQDSV